VDPTGVLTQLADNQGMTAKFLTLSLGQGQAPIATRFIIKSSYNCTIYLCVYMYTGYFEIRDLKLPYFIFYFD